MRAFRAGMLCLAFGLSMTTATATAGGMGGIGVLGDSYSDEYQFYAPDRSAARNWVELLAALRGLDFGRFVLDGRGAPRNQGYEHNWARSDATTDDLIAEGQHTGLAAQVASRRVSLVVIFIGGNDFLHALESPDPSSALDRALTRALSNYRITLETILKAHPEVKVVVATVPDLRDLPDISEALRRGRIPSALAERCVTAQREYNAQVRSLAVTNPRVALADFEVVARIANLASRDFAFVMGRKLDRTRTGNDLDHLFLNDNRHMGTLGQGIMAQMFVNAINAKFAAGVTPVGDREVIEFARSIGAVPDPAKKLAELGPKPPQGALPGRSAP